MKDIVGIKWFEMSLSVTMDSTNGDDTIRSKKPALPSLAAILACREASPVIMEHEKTILVMKEHDYARTPDMSQLAPLFRQLLTGEVAATVDAEVQRSDCATAMKPTGRDSELFNVRQALANARESLLKDNGAMSSHLNKMVSLQTTLIQQLQEQVFFKGLETTTIKREKEQLEARLERMERRLSVLQKRSKRKDGGDTSEVECIDDPTTPTSVSSTPPMTPSIASTPNVVTSTAKPEQVTRLARSESVSGRNSRSRSSSIEVTSRRNSRTANSILEVSHRASKRGLEGGGVGMSSTNKKIRSSSPVDEDLTTEVCYCGLGLNHSSVGGAGPLDTPTDDMSKEEQTDLFVKVPSWRKLQVPSDDGAIMNKNGANVPEDSSDDSFAKRHSKPENEEKRRKRWDAQRMRERLHHDQLLKRYMMKEGCSPQPEKKKEKLASFFPKLEDIEEIELTDSLIVSAFGRPIPKIKPTVFRLPNFDPTAVKSTRGKPKGKTATQNYT